VSYRVRFDPVAERALLDLAKDARQRIIARLQALAHDPRPSTTQPLVGNLKGLRKLRVGAYRVAYRVDDEARTVTISEIGHRGKFYQKTGRGRG